MLATEGNTVAISQHDAIFHADEISFSDDKLVLSGQKLSTMLATEGNAVAISQHDAIKYRIEIRKIAQR